MVVACLAGCSKPESKPAPAPPPAPVVADAAVGSPAVRLFDEWLAAFNAADFKAVHAFTLAHTPGKPDVGDEDFRKMTGGFEVKRIRDVSPTVAEAIVTDKNAGQFARAEVRLDPADAKHILYFDVIAIDTPDEFLTPAQRQERSLDPAKRTALIDRIAAVLAKSYLDADKAKTLASAIRDHATKGDYDKIVDGPGFSKRLTEDLQAAVHDLHLRVLYGSHPAVEPPPPPEAEQLKQLREMNFGFGSIERVGGNVAHVVIDAFPSVAFESGRKGIGDLMSQVADADALIIDLRTNHGGAPDTVALVASYVFDAKPVHLIDTYERETNKTTPSWTLAKVAGTRFGGKKPVYVLTSKTTFSGGEELAFVLQAQKRAKIVGETTGGGAHPTKVVSLDDWFQLAVPYAEPRGPHGNWEGTGVKPDVPTTADAALDEALKLVDHR